MKYYTYNLNLYIYIVFIGIYLTYNSIFNHLVLSKNPSKNDISYTRKFYNIYLF